MLHKQLAVYQHEHNIAIAILAVISNSIHKINCVTFELKQEVFSMGDIHMACCF